MRFVLLLFLLISSIFSKEISTRYGVHVTLFGDVGYADISLKEHDNSYEIKLTANTTGVAATLLKNRVETFISKGKIVEGRYIPDIFIETKETTKRLRVRTYYFDHEKKEVKFIEEKTKLVNVTKFDLKDFNLITEEVKKSFTQESTLDIYKDSDVLTSYLNTKTTCNSEKKFYKLIAFGANDEKNDITVSCLEGAKKESAILNFSDSTQDIYNLHVEPFDKEDDIVDVLIAFDNDGLLKEAFLGEIFWVGKITAKRVYHEISQN
ncbi:DUF3108 domain-containing protein [Sulfurimonas sp.]|jgi:hypothetical protein|uniref:DUF3108 domain-containing protein n=1 Tax=Sulfurimonas sp. TaxID=2022749 RepID=UPI0025ECE1EA|nr:DUF3108 domain-containing protein [Sulfurimonas sp.]MCK9472918.1 DUF3108 domain-containing protein [Sulfurimonas sp.]MDD3506299.1 DUF3108 domain-containing protein [Sulfurimonas sp.]